MISLDMSELLFWSPLSIFTCRVNRLLYPFAGADCVVRRFNLDSRCVLVFLFRYFWLLEDFCVQELGVLLMYMLLQRPISILQRISRCLIGWCIVLSSSSGLDDGYSTKWTPDRFHNGLLSLLVSFLCHNDP